MVVKLFSILLSGFIILNLNDGVHGANILGIVTASGRSHLIFHTTLLKGLAAKGHNVTVVATIPSLDKEIPNYRHIYVKLDEDYKMKNMMTNLLEDAGKGSTGISRFPEMANTITQRGNLTLNHRIMKQIMREDSFDLVVVGYFFNDFEFGLASHFKCPLVVSCSMPAVRILQDFVGNPYAISSVASIALDTIGPMTFFQRVISFIMTIIEVVFMKVMQMVYYEKIYQYNFPSDKYPSLKDAQRNISLLITNEHFSYNRILPTVPAIIPVGGMQVKSSSDPLPKEIEEFLDNAENGAILFSLGSNIKGADMSIEVRNKFLGAFAKLKQRIIWKFEGESMANMPHNVMIRDWLPQDDILAHPNIVLFISHGGLGSLTESLHRGVPILGIPIFGDQNSNVQKIVHAGWALSLPYVEVNEKRLYDSIYEMVTNPKYRETVRKISNLIQDRPQTPLEAAVFWTEYVIRHKGAKHMQSHAVHLNYFQLFSLDVIGFCVVFLWAVWKILKLIFGKIFRKCCSSNKSKTE